MSRIAVVTGVSSGIGAAVCAEFQRQGWQVIGVGRHDAPQPLDRFERADLSQPDAVADLFSRLADVEQIHALVNNAARGLDKPLAETSDEEWQAVFDLNVKSAFQMMRAATTQLARANGAIVNVSSVHAVATSINVAAYAASKGALVALTRATALELAPQGIRCNAVLPGAVATPMLEAGLSRRPHPEGPEGNRQNLIDKTPLGFIATPEQIAPSIVHFADEQQTPYLTGQTLVIDGGATARLSTE
ncbi:MAG: SDR family NAD(P)-dependent oxidoreductase [Acidimicrobiales bacterium]|nr:SDR family NAD(P)-dependent oxidoreductase [Acidimicrobiales bacterium]